MSLTDNKNLQKIAIIVIGYNRLSTTSRLLASLNDAKYESNDIPLIISIDKSGNEQLYNYVREFEWKHGEKIALIREERLGLERHIFECGNLSQFFRAVVVLEDDVIVAPDFYNYFSRAVDKYENDNRIACISAYFNFLYGYVGLPFYPMSQYDVFAQQEVSSTGECFTRRMWNDFIEWKSKNTPLDFTPFDMPEKIKRWRDAWTKYFNAYMVSHDKYCIYPVFSTITNSGAAGVHSSHSETVVQTYLMTGHREWVLPNFDELTKYDLYGNNTMLYESLRISRDDLCLDMYGNNQNMEGKRYILSVRKLPYAIIKGFELSYRPHELNIFFNVKGEDICLYDSSIKCKHNKKNIDSDVIYYYLYGFQIKFLPKYVISRLFSLLKDKLIKKLHC